MSDHIADCKCKSVYDIEYDSYSKDYSDKRCKELNKKRYNSILERASKSMRQMPKYFRMDGKDTAYDDLHNACWNLTDEEITKVAKYANKILKSKRK